MDSFFLTRLVVWYAVFLFSTTLHEAMHAYASAYGGDDTAYQSGQATLNPIPHMVRSKFGMIVVPLASFFLQGGNWMIGWASAPFNPLWAARYPKRSFLMSLAGPLSHLLPAGLAFLGMYIGLRTGFFGPPDARLEMFPVSMAGESSLSYALALLCNVVFQLNLVLLVFNLMPCPPLDGSEIWFLFMKREEDRLRWRHIFSSYAFAGLLVAWHYFPRVYYPLFARLLHLLY
ncbi:MAG: site-2 protease family protein [Planctomycetes bacterium]|nr:site-2 protease family protein [Planctomycetota bacterium]